MCFSTGFPKLTKLAICNFPQLYEIIIEKGAMPNVKYLEVDSCMKLKTMPKGSEFLNFQELFLRSVSMELKNRIQRECSMDFPKVCHIPKIYVSSNSGFFMKVCPGSFRKVSFLILYVFLLLFILNLMVFAFMTYSIYIINPLSLSLLFSTKSC